MPARFVVRLTPSFQRDLDALPKASQEKVLIAIRRLETNPSGPPPKIKKLNSLVERVCGIYTRVARLAVSPRLEVLRIVERLHACEP